MFLHRVVVEGLAHHSFVVACGRTREAAVIDPRRDVDVYLEIARQHGLHLVYAIETHIHADFVSGARELAQSSVRTICGPGSSLQFDAHEVIDGEVLGLGDLRLQFLHTPGHTPEHIAVLVESAGEPARVFTGDALFVGAVGRPDLLGEAVMRQLAYDLHTTLFDKLLALSDDVEVHPAHGAGSLCGKGIAHEPSSTIGAERQFNPMLRHRDRETFVRAVLEDRPETPPYFPRMKRTNHDGPPVLGLAAGVPDVRPLSAAEAASLVKEGALLVDTRQAQAFGEGHPQGAINLGFGPKLGYWAGWVLPEGARVVLLVEHASHSNEVTRQLLRVGYENLAGYIDGGFAAWRNAGGPVRQVPQISAPELLERAGAPAGLQVVDVRTASEWQTGHLPGAIHVPVGAIADRADEIARTAGRKTVATVCERGYRASLAASLLARAGVPDVVNVTGGMAAVRSVRPV